MSSVRSSVRPSVTLVDCDHIGWNSSKIISLLVRVGRSLSADPNIMDLLQGKQPEIWAQSAPPPVDLSFGVGDIRSQIAAATVTMESLYRKPPLLFRMVSSLTPTTSSLSQNGVPYALMIGEWPYLRNERTDTLHVWLVWFSGDRMVLFRVISNPR